MSQPYLFLNYRQADTRHAAQRLHADLERHLEPDQIFLDRESIQGGEPRPERLRREAERATAMFTLIGDRWTVPMDDGSGERRLDQEDDWVRLEIAGALARGIDVLPVWVDGHEPNLQLILRRLADLLPLAERQAKTLSSATAAQWEHDVAQLVAWLVDQGFRPRSQVLPPREPDAVEVLAAYRQAVCRDHRCMVPFLEQTSDQLLEKVYVEIHVDVHGAEAEARDGDDRDLPAGRTLHALLAPRATATARRWVVLGEPGAGKSTVARRLALQLAKDDHGPLPVYLSLPGLCQSPRDALALAEEDTATPGAAAALRGAATEGRVWLLLDGLDEVAGTELERARKRVLALADEFPRCPMAVLSRPIGYRDLPAPFRRAALEPLEEAAQQDLLTHWLGATHGTVTWQAIGKRPGLARLARNPLLLTMIAGLSKARPDLPTHRGQLYDRAIDLLLRRGARPQVQADDGTGPPAGVREPGTARRLLAALALALQDHKGATWTETQLGDALRAALAEDPALRRALEENWTNVPNALKDIAHHGAVLGPHKGARRPWEFLHRQFREFLAAEALAAGGEAAWLERVGKLQHKDIARWSETLAFVCLRSPDPQPPLVALRDRSAAAARRAVVEIETLPPSEGLAFLLETEGCDGEDVVRLVEGWRARGLPVEGLIDVLREQVAPARPTPHLSWIHAGLSLLGPVDSEQFFTQCERPRPAQDDTDYVAVPAGTFVMGSPEDEPERLNSEGPQHRVRVGALWLARTAVTNAQYARFAPDHKRRAWAGIPKAELARHPVVAVSWWEACLYCAWLGARLPSEAEWEYACRAGSTTPFSTGTQLSTDEANYDGNYPYTDGAKGEYRERTVPVGSMPPNAWGLHEVHGNVREWCQDTWHDSYEGAPADGSPWESDGSVLRVVRGGSWFFDAGWCRSAVRDRRRAGGRVDYVGFRPARASRP